MDCTFVDAETILSGNEHWTKLDIEWGPPVDLETEDSELIFDPVIPSYLSTLNLKKTFDSAPLIKRFKKACNSRTLPRENYEDFIQDLEERFPRASPQKPFYFIGGQIISAASVDDICEDIDNVFESVEKLCSATSTLRPKAVSKVPNIVQCSISCTGLSFDDTPSSVELAKDTVADEAVNRYIDELFDTLNNTVSTLQRSLKSDKSIDVLNTSNSVTTLVRKFSSFLTSPMLKCNPRKRRECCERFQELAEFWENRM